MFKIFPRTVDGDQIALEFDYKEEADAFEVGLHQLKRMRDFLRRNESTEEFTVKDTEFPYEMRVAEVKPNVNLLTTLQVQCLNHYRGDLPGVLGVHICNVFTRNSIHMSVFTGEVKS